MQISGTISNVVPDGGYNGTNGYISTFQMTIQCQDGKTFTGQIGSKSQTYPVGVGQPITVELTNTQHGVRFKKINPQYQQQQQQYQQPQQASQPSPAALSPAGRDNTQDRIAWAQAVNLTFLMYVHDKREPAMIQETQCEIYELLTQRKFASWMSCDSEVFDDPL